jgi:hypothetical protein
VAILPLFYQALATVTGIERWRGKFDLTNVDGGAWRTTFSASVASALRPSTQP